MVRSPVEFWFSGTLTKGVIIRDSSSFQFQQKPLSYSKRLKRHCKDTLEHHRMKFIHILWMHIIQSSEVTSLLTDSNPWVRWCGTAACPPSPTWREVIRQQRENKSYYSTSKSKTEWDDKHPSYRQIDLRRWNISSIQLGEVRFLDGVPGSIFP